jgi:DNA repair protein SbcD/Mre11
MKTPTALWFTDPHLSDDTLEVNRSVYIQVLQLCLDNNIPGVILGGDVFDSRKGQSEQVLTTFAQLVELFRDHDINLIIIPGNHDKTDYTSSESFLNAYGLISGVFLYKEYGYIDHTEKQLRFHFIPYFDEHLAYQQRLDQAIANVRFDYKNILFTHVAVKGVMNNDGTKVDNGLNAGQFKDFYKVLVGHYHNRQLISNNILYTGSTHQANFGEDDKKGCTVIYDDGSIEHVQLQFPKYVTVTFDDPSTIGKLRNTNVTDHYRVKFKCKPTTEQVQMFKQQGVKVEIDYEIEHTDHIQDVKTQFSHGDIVTYFSQWCDEKGIEDKEFGLKQLQG